MKIANGVLGIMMFSFMLYSVGAISTDLKDKYSPLETVSLKISGSVLDVIDSEMFEIKRINVKMPVEYDIKRLGNDYYVWFITPENENNYTLYIKNISTYSNGKVSSITYEKNFTVEGNKSDYYIKPGFVITNSSFSLDIVSQGDYNREINVNVVGSEKINLIPGYNKLDLQLNYAEEKLTYIIVGNYNLPVYYYLEKKISPDISNSQLVFMPIRLERKVLIGGYLPQYSILIENKKNKAADVLVRYNLDNFVITPNNFSLPGNDSIYVNLTLKRYIEGNINDNISFYYGDETFNLPINIKFSKNDSDFIALNDSESNYSIMEFSCSELGGIKCSADEICSIDEIISSDGGCCRGLCNKKLPDEGGSYSWIGYVLGLVIVLILVYVYMKYKKTKKDSNPIIKEMKRAEDKLP